MSTTEALTSASGSDTIKPKATRKATLNCHGTVIHKEGEASAEFEAIYNFECSKMYKMPSEVTEILKELQSAFEADCNNRVKEYVNRGWVTQSEIHNCVEDWQYSIGTKLLEKNFEEKLKPHVQFSVERHVHILELPADESDESETLVRYKYTRTRDLGE